MSRELAGPVPRIADKRVIRLIVKWLNAGVMEDGEWQDNMRGTPQGSVISPTLANIYLHYVLDLWFQKKWRVHEVKGDTIIVRYADDFVVGFQHKQDAERFLHDLKERLGRASNWNCTLTRPGSSSSDGSRLRTVGNEGWVNRRRSTFWASRTLRERHDRSALRHSRSAEADDGVS